MTRREFLARSGLAAAALPLSSIAGRAQADAPLARRGAPRNILIIGAGLAGLAAGYELTRAGHAVTIFEARTRPGGRVQTLRDPFADGLYAEAGATRVPNHHHFTIKYVNHFGLSLIPFEAPDLPPEYFVRGTRLRAAAGQQPQWPHALTAEERALGLAGMREKYIWSMLHEVGDVTDPGWPSAETVRRYDAMNRSDFWRSRGASPEAIALLGLGGIDDRADTWSTLFMLRNQALNRALTSYSKIKGGSDLLPKAFAARLAASIRYGAPVSRIEHSPDGVRCILREAGAYRVVPGDYLICAVPFAVQKDIEVTPAFSLEKQRAIEQLPYLSGTKIFLQSKTRFWTSQRQSGFAITDLPIGQIWDMTYGQPGTRGILQGFPISLHARRVAGMTETERLVFGLDQVSMLYPNMREQFEGGVTKCWDDDPWSRGISAYYKPGQFSSLAPHVARPEGRIHFAGEHTSPWIDGWMQGALESGERVAREVNSAAQG